MHHLLLLLPLLALGLFMVWPWQLALPVYVPVAIIALVGYWKALQATRQPAATGTKAMIGGRAVVLTAKEGTLEAEVDYEGEIWRAISTRQLHAGDQVIIEAVDGLTLRVSPSPQRADGSRGR